MPSKYNKKIWLGISTPFQVNFFYQLMKRLEGKVDFLVTAREHDRIIPMLEAKGIEYYTVGKHGGKELDGKLLAYANSIQQLTPVIKKEKPDLLITERWPEAVRTAFGFNIPSWAIFYDEREFHVNWMTFPLSSKIFVPTFYNLEELKAQGVTETKKIVWFNGFHTCYLKGSNFDKSQNPFTALGLKPPVVLVRPEPEFAAFFTEGKQRILEDTVSLLKKEFNPNIVVFPRNEKQAESFPKGIVKIFDDVTIDCPVAYADVTLGAAETMLMESFVLGTPTVSAVYWPPAKPVTELHKYIPHSTDPKELVKETVRFFDTEVSGKFREMAKATVGRMENPIDKMADEIELLFGSKPILSTRRRSRMELLADILQSMTHEPIIFSHLIQKSNVTSRELKADLKLLISKDLAESFVGKSGKVYYKATKKGTEVIQDFNRLTETLSL